MSGLDLYLSQRTLALLFVYAALTGFGLGVVYDGLRVLRMALGDARTPASGQGRKRRPLAILLFAEDVLFMLATAVALILLCYYANDGQLRAPAPVGMACGFFVYMQTVSRLTVRLAEAVLGLVRRGLLWFLGLLAIPLRGLWSLTVGRMMALRRERATDKGIRALTESALQGFDILDEDCCEHNDRRGRKNREDHAKKQEPPA